MSRPTPEEIRNQFDYDDGELLLVKGNRTKPAGSLAGSQTDSGAWRINVQGQAYSRAELVWVWVNGAWPSGFICHVEDDPADDRVENLVEMDRPNRSQFERRRAHAVATHLAAVISNNAVAIGGGK